MMNSDQYEFETFKCAWSEYAPNLRDQNDGHLQDQLLICVEGDMRKALASRLGTHRLAEIVEKKLDLLNKVKLFEAVQGPSELIINFIHRLQILAYKCTFTTSCSG